MHGCSVCKSTLSQVLMNNRLVCFKCDELLFDIEIECEEKEIIKEPTTTGVTQWVSTNKVIGSK
jgi:hypothetical protein